MNKVRILRNFPISLDGISVQTWKAGAEHSVDDATLDLLIGEGACELVETKAMAAAPENKAKPKRRARKART